MTSNIYEERINIANFSLSYLPTLKIFGTEHKGVETYRDNEEKLMFLYLKSMNLSNMMFPYTIPRSDKTPIFAFVINNTLDKSTLTVGKPLFNGGSFTYSLDSYVSLINDKIFDYVSPMRTMIVDKIAYPQFRVNEHQLYCKYHYVNGAGSKTGKLATFVFDNAIWEVIGKYFDLECYKDEASDNVLYKILPILTLDDVNSYAADSVVQSYAYPIRDTTEFFHSRWKINIEISYDLNPKFGPTDRDYTKTSFDIYTDKSHLELGKYILLNNRLYSGEPLSYRITVPLSLNIIYLNDIEIRLEGQYIVLQDIYNQFDCFNLQAGNIYTSDEYRELSYRKLMGITAQTVYLQNGTSTEKLQEIVERLRDHFPDIGDPKNASTWKTLRDLLDKKDFIEEIYNLLYQIHPVQSLGPPDSKKGKIEF